MKKIFIIGAVILCLCGLRACGAWMHENEKKSYESCRMVHSDENCRMWAARGY